MEIVEYRDEFKDSIVSLWGFDKDSNYVKNKAAIWDWQYSGNPCADQLCKGFVCIEEGEVVGFLGTMPVMLKYGDRTIEAHWTLDGVMNPKTRGKGYGVKMYDLGVRTAKYVYMGIGMTDITEHLLKKAGCQANQEVVQSFYTNKPADLRAAAKKVVQQLNVLKNLARRPAKGDLKVRVVDAREMPKEIDALWDRVQGGYEKIVVRDYSYMDWKYRRHPLARYQLILVERGSELVGVGVFRKSAARASLVDFVGPAKDLPVKFQIAKAFRDACSESAFVKCLCSDEEINTALGYVGFRRYKKKERFYVYSNIEGDQDFLINWFIMGGESDNDIGDHLVELQVKSE